VPFHLWRGPRRWIVSLPVDRRADQSRGGRCSASLVPPVSTTQGRLEAEQGARAGPASSGGACLSSGRFPPLDVRNVQGRDDFAAQGGRPARYPSRGRPRASSGNLFSDKTLISAVRGQPRPFGRRAPERLGSERGSRLGGQARPGPRSCRPCPACRPVFGERDVPRVRRRAASARRPLPPGQRRAQPCRPAGTVATGSPVPNNLRNPCRGAVGTLGGQLPTLRGEIDAPVGSANPTWPTISANCFFDRRTHHAAPSHGSVLTDECKRWGPASLATCPLKRSE